MCDVLATAMAELPNLLPPADVAEALLRLKYGPEIICHIVANQPDSFRDGDYCQTFAMLKNYYSAFYRFGQSKHGYGALVLVRANFLYCLNCPDSKVFINGSKVIVSLH